MSIHKHTPGPWSTYVEKWPNKIVIRSMFTDGTERAQVAVTSAENAHLIAAAPKLLAALHGLLQFPGGQYSESDGFDEAWAAAKAAYAEATGEQP